MFTGPGFEFGVLYFLSIDRVIYIAMEKMPEDFFLVTDILYIKKTVQRILLKNCHEKKFCSGWVFFVLVINV